LRIKELEDEAEKNQKVNESEVFWELLQREAGKLE